MVAASLAEWSTFVRAAAAVLWPIIVLVAVWLLRDPLREMIGRLREAKVGSVGVVFSEKLEQVAEGVSSVAESETLPPEDRDKLLALRSDLDDLSRALADAIAALERGSNKDLNAYLATLIIQQRNRSTHQSVHQPPREPDGPT